MTFTAPFYRPLLRRCLGYALLVGMLAGCQSSATELPAARLVASTAPTTADSATAPATPDSLRLTPLAPLAAVPASLHQAVQALHTALGPEAATLRPEVLERACIGYLTLRQAHKIDQPGIMAVADMDLPSSEKRLWVVDLRRGEVLQHSHVAHGRGSGHLRAGASPTS